MNKIETILQNDIRTNLEFETILYKGEVFTYFDMGLTRYCFVNEDKTKVIKILIEKDSVDFNQEEYNIYQNASDEKKAKMAETKLGLNGMFIEQEFCNPIKFDDRSLTIKQTLFANKCRNEVGWNSNGELVCFDLDEYMKY